MAARPGRLTALAALAALAVWIWALAGVLYTLRWNSVERPLPPPKDIFLYGEFRVGVDASNPPFAVATRDDLFGLDIDLANTLGARLGIPVRFVPLGYDGLYDALRVDQVDALISAVLVDSTRNGQVMYTLPYFNAGLVLVSDRAAPYTSMKAMPGHSVAFEFGSNADAETRRWLRRVLPFERKPYELAQYELDAVRLGQADAALVDATTARLYLRDHPEWAAQYDAVTDANYAIAVRIDRGQTWDAINRTLAGMIADGSLEAIVRKWL